jgi:hypothetical protein
VTDAVMPAEPGVTIFSVTENCVVASAAIEAASHVNVMRCLIKSCKALRRLLPAAATKLLHAISTSRKLLTCQRESGLSLQSIMGATDIFLLRVKGMHSIHESHFR